MTHEPAMTIPETDDALDRLNPVERDLLGLLGRGHTAKSIATLRSMSEAAVNERFRSARRKTGIGSSREIARLIVAQENRHDFIGLAPPAAPPPELRRPDAPHRASSNRWRLLMAAALILTAAILAQQTATPPTAGAQIPAGAEVMFEPRETAPDTVVLHDRIARDPIDPIWSPATQAGLSRAYRAGTDPLASVGSMSVACSADLCEVVGVGRYGLSGDETNALMQVLQGQGIQEEASALGLNHVLSGFNSTYDNARPDASTALVFVAYWTRQER